MHHINKVNQLLAKLEFGRWLAKMGKRHRYLTSHPGNSEAQCGHFFVGK